MKTKKALFLLTIIIALAFSILSCEEEEKHETPPEDEDLIPITDGKYDTGYLSTLATELEGEFSGTLKLDISSMTSAEISSLKNSFESNSWTAKSLIMDQIKYGKNKLNTELLHMNLYSDDFEIENVEERDGKLIVTYKALLESIVSHEELEKKGSSIDNILNKTTIIKLPADPRNIYDRVGDSCAEGFEQGSLANYNYFYYFKPDKEGCNIELVEAQFTVRSLAPTEETTYPEYDLLTADGKITVAVFFGAAEHSQEVSSWDWGVREWRDFVYDIKNRGFQKVENLNPGERYRRVKNGIEEIIDIVSPYDLHALTHDTNGIFKNAIKEHEIIIYAGHSFYGSLNVLRDRDAYPEKTYQIFMMNSCWSYEYYTTQIFQNKVTDDDPHGWKYADVVNNTEVGWFHNNAEEIRILLTNIFRGAETGGIDEEGRYYTWINIIGAMNRFAIERWKQLGTETHEIYGVSGVKGNRYDPEVRDNGETDNGNTSIRYTNNEKITIPDNNPNGISSLISVNQHIIPTEIRVNVDISHSWIGDLIVKLVRNETEVVLHNKEGEWEDNIVKEYIIRDARLLNRDGYGEWYLKVIDTASGDEGTLISWSLILVP